MLTINNTGELTVGEHHPEGASVGYHMACASRCGTHDADDAR